MNYYNEHDPKAAAWLRELIAQRHIPEGHVDERSIAHVSAGDLEGYTQCHFFAGIGGWSLALRLAGWPEGRPVWTGSCPCQPFSSAGQQKAQADPRHLWPVFFQLIRQRRPECVLGEQVASAIGHGWLDGISADLEQENYTCGSVVLGAHSVGAPHIRQRLYWVANTSDDRCTEHGQEPGPRSGAGPRDTSERDAARRLADSNGQHTGPERQQRSGEHGQQSEDSGLDRLEHPTGDGRDERRAQPDGRSASGGCSTGSERMGHAASDDKSRQRESNPLDRREGAIGRSGPGSDPAGGMEHSALPEAARFRSQQHQLHAPANAWSNFDLLPCLDGKARRVESGTFPLAHGVPGRVELLRGYGNAIVPQVAAEFIQAFLEVE